MNEMKLKKMLACLTVAVAMCAAPALAEDSWKGKISDSMCKAKHGGGEHAKKMTDRECAEKCIDGGASYVFVGEGDKVYSIANQKFPGLKTHAGHDVTVTGTMKGDTLTVTKIEMPKAEPKGAAKD
jgi:hypothetical protein